jgi:DNA-binding SARP family transcriptional activator
VEIDGVQLAGGLRGRQVPLLLAYLLLNRSRHVGRDELIGALWPNRAPVSQDAALRTLLSRLRSALGSDALTGRDELVLALPEPVWIDLEAAAAGIERAMGALEGGDARGAWALAQVPLNIAGRGLLPGAQADWLEPRRRELADIRLQALEVIGNAGLRLGGSQLASAERAARSLIEIEPYRESGYVLLMDALAAKGNVAEGLMVFERVRRLMRDELGTTPSPETIAAHQRLLAPDARGAAIKGEDERAQIALPAELLLHADAPLIGRQAELAELDRIWAIAGAGRQNGERGRCVLLTGDPGIGKTRLVAEIARRAHEAGAFVLAGRSPEEALVPYQPFVEAIRHYVVNVPFAELRVSARDYGSELSRLVPELRRRAPELPPPLEGDPETERYRLFEAVVGMLNAIAATAPVLLVLDDLHWADRPTLLLLRHLARAPHPGRVLVLGAYRATETALGGLERALSELRHERLVTLMRVEGLDLDETAELVETRSGSRPTPSFSRALHAETEGNPLFIEELLRHLAEAGVQPGRAGRRELERFGLPEGIKQLIARRLERLDAQAIEWLRVAAVIGRDFDLGPLERILSLDEESFLGALDGVLAAGLVAESPLRTGRYSFSHALIRETLYEGLSAPRRARIHRRVGEALEAEAPEASLRALALHFTRAAGPQEAEKAIEYATRAGEQASSVLAHEEAADHYQRALEVLEQFRPEESERRVELLIALGEARVRAGERPLAWEPFREAAALAAKSGDGGRLARAAIGASRRYVQEPGVVNEELIGMLEQALEMSAGKRTLTRVMLLGRLCGAIYYSPSLRGRMAALSDEARAIAEELGDVEAQAYAWAARRRARWEPAELEERLAASTELLRCARQIGNLELELHAHAWLVVDLLERGERDAVEAQVTAFTDGAQRLRQPFYLWQVALWRAMLALLAGRLGDASELAQEALAVGAGAEQVTAPQYYAIQLLTIAREQDRAAELEPLARQFVSASPGVPAWRAAVARLQYEAGRAEEARIEFEQLAANDFRDLPQDGNWMTAITLLGELCFELRDARRAESLYELLLPFSGVNVVVGVAVVCQGSTERFLGLLAAAAGRATDARRHFERALLANEALRAPVCLAHTQLDYARVLGGLDGAVGARGSELVSAAARTAQELELPAIARQAQELKAG